MAEPIADPSAVSAPPATPEPVAPPPAPAPTAEPAPATPPTPVAKPHTMASDLSEITLKQRLDETRTKTLKDLGFASLEEAQAAAKELADRREAAKTSEQKHAEALTARQAAETRLAEQSKYFQTKRTELEPKLTDSQKALLAEGAGDDPVKWVRMAELMGAAHPAAPTAPEAAPPALPAPPPKNIDTAPHPNAPAPGGTNTAPDLRSVVSEVSKTNPFLAANIINQNQATFSKRPDA